MTRNAVTDIRGWIAGLDWGWLDAIQNWFGGLPWDSIGSFVLGFFVASLLSVLKRRTDTGLDKLLDRGMAYISRRRQERAARRSQRRKAATEAQALAQVRMDRVGRKFLHRVSADDSGLIGEVVDLDQRQPKARVLVVWTNPTERTPTTYDPAVNQRISYEWRQLVRPSSTQKHWTARNIAQSHDDADGWVQFEDISGLTSNRQSGPGSD